MKIRVECYAGHRGEEEPRAFTLGEVAVAWVVKAALARAGVKPA